MEVPTYVTAAVVATSVGAVLAIFAVLRCARNRAGGHGWAPEAVGVALVAWLTATMAFAGVGAYRPTSGEAIPGVAVPFAIGLGSGLLAILRILPLRALLGQPATHPSLVTVQMWWFFGGAVFLILLRAGQGGTVMGRCRPGSGTSRSASRLQGSPVASDGPADGRRLSEERVRPHRSRRGHGPWRDGEPGRSASLPHPSSAELLTAFPMALIPTFCTSRRFSIWSAHDRPHPMWSPRKDRRRTRGGSDMAIRSTSLVPTTGEPLWHARLGAAV
jgi:hypothetical protein